MDIKKSICVLIACIIVSVTGCKSSDEIKKDVFKYDEERYADAPYKEYKTYKTYKTNPHTWVSRINSRSGWYTVYATRIGLIGRRTASGRILRSNTICVALPHRNALWRTVAVKYRGTVVVCPVLDVGPHSTRDAYWVKGKRPLAESGLRIPYRWIKKYGRPKNRAGIDLSDGLWKILCKGEGGKGIIVVSWKFVG